LKYAFELKFPYPALQFQKEPVQFPCHESWTW